jgi:hypothetical protein
LPRAIQDQELVLDHDGFGNDRTDATRPCEPGRRDEQMNQKEDDFAHLGIVAKRGQNDEFWLNLAIRHPQVKEVLRAFLAG